MPSNDITWVKKLKMSNNVYHWTLRYHEYDNIIMLIITRYIITLLKDTRRDQPNLLVCAPYNSSRAYHVFGTPAVDAP